MIKKLFTLLIGLIFIFFATSNVLANEELVTVEYDGNILNGEAIFYFDDVKPGDEIEKDIKVTNISEIAQLIKVSCKEVENFKDLAEIMEITITTNSTTLYDGTLLQFCTVDAALPGSLPLTIVPSEDFDIYNFYFYFPHEAGNEYQKSKYVFNLYFDPRLPEGDHIVINEVYYWPDEEHGVDIKNCCGEVNAEISNNGAFSRNIINIKISNQCLVVQENKAKILNNINVKSNTGGNSNNGNNGNSSISTGISGLLARIRNRINYNVAFGACNSVNARNDEWVELYNPTSEDVSLKDWGLIDNSGNRTTIHANKIIKSGGFALISKNAQTWTYWDVSDDTLIVETGQILGNGLDNDGDHLFLVDNNEDEVDFTAWQDDEERWNPAVPSVDEGHSIERLLPGFDNDVPEDWEDRYLPTPGE